MTVGVAGIAVAGVAVAGVAVAGVAVAGVAAADTGGMDVGVVPGDVAATGLLVEAIVAIGRDVVLEGLDVDEEVAPFNDLCNASNPKAEANTAPVGTVAGNLATLTAMLLVARIARRPSNS